jgi:cytochrome c-type biogenesis protein CcmF
MLAGWSAAVSIASRQLPDAMVARVLGVLGLVSAGFMLFTLFTSNPFERVLPPPADGRDLNPLLQDPGLIFHPPMLYMGYVGFSVAFAFALGALIGGRLDATWARWSRPWTVAAWIFLTLGIALGSYWAYYELGWGGWWFWDPVENASFMPWLAGTALLHSALVVERRNALLSWTILLGILTFSLSLIGTFLVRSGVLTSVHSFAQDPARGAFILVLIVIATGGGLTLFAIRAPEMKHGPLFAAVSRESGLVVNNVLLITAVGTVFLGTFYPLVVDMLGNDKISVGPPYYNMTFVPIMVPLLLVMVVGPALRWKRDELRAALVRLRPAAIAATLTVVALLAFTLGQHFLVAFFMGLAVWLVLGSLLVLAQRTRLGSTPLATTLRLARTTPLAVYGLVLAHAGLGVTVAGITGMTAWASEKIEMLRPGQSLQLAGYDVRLRSVAEVPGPNYEAERAIFDISRNGKPSTQLSSERRFYPVRRQLTTAAGIRTNLVSNVYVTLGDPGNAGAWAVRFYYHPFIPLVWIGALMMALGGFVSLADRRLRVGAPQRAAQPVPFAAPAE